MSVRTVLALALLFSALPALAREAPSGSPQDQGCSADQGAAGAATDDPARASRRPEAEKPALPRGASPDVSRPGPRWHSFLPGMFR